MIYDVIIIGGGASGLFAGAFLPKNKSNLILEKSKSPGKKLLMSGSGQCNLTHGGNIKDFLSCYRENGKHIRKILYGFNNEALVDFFEKRGLPCQEREDGKVFPKSLKAHDVLNVLLHCCKENNTKIKSNSPVTGIKLLDNVYHITCSDHTYMAKKIVVATGGASYPTTGSDGSFFKILSSMGLSITECRPALTPISVHNYPYSQLSGISFKGTVVTLLPKAVDVTLPPAVSLPKSISKTGDILFTHDSLSGPAILNLSGYAKSGDTLKLNYFPFGDFDTLVSEMKKASNANAKQASAFFYEFLQSKIKPYKELSFPKRFSDTLLQRINISPQKKASQLSGNELTAFLTLITTDSFKISGLGGLNIAMVTGGGVSLSEINLKTLESKKFPNLFIIGEALDVDGETGGYNLQFAFSSACFACKNL